MLIISDLHLLSQTDVVNLDINHRNDLNKMLRIGRIVKKMNL